MLKQNSPKYDVVATTLHEAWFHYAIEFQIVAKRSYTRHITMKYSDIIKMGLSAKLTGKQYNSCLFDF